MDKSRRPHRFMIVAVICTAAILSYGVWVSRENLSLSVCASLTGCGVLLLLIALLLTEAMKGRFVPRWVGWLLITGVATLVLYMVDRLLQISPGDWAQIILMFGLVAVTTFYAWSASRQARQMEEQRRDAVRPVIDIQRRAKPVEPRRQLLEAYAASQDDTSHGLQCALHNVGVGPAVDVFSFIVHPTQGRLRWSFGPIVANKETDEIVIAIEHRNSRAVLVAYYHDVQGNWFESSREVRIEQTPNPSWVLDHLEIRPIDKSELPHY